jgi:hypothetical protein
MLERSGLKDPTVQRIKWIVTGKIAPAAPLEKIGECLLN